MIIGNPKVGDPVILQNAADLQGPLYDGMKGDLTSLVTVEDKDYAFFMPLGMLQIFVIDIGRLAIDEERMEEQFANSVN